MRYKNGCPNEIGDLYPEPGLNDPYHPASLGVLLEHIRALSGFVAQLHHRVSELETEREKRKE